MRALLELTEEERAEMRREAVEQLKAELTLERARAVDDLTSFSIEEIASAKGVSIPTAKALMTRLGISKEKLSYKLKRFPLRELKLAFDGITIKGLRALRERRAA
jgi:hypothetical protein